MGDGGRYPSSGWNLHCMAVGGGMKSHFIRGHLLTLFQMLMDVGYNISDNCPFIIVENIFYFI